MCTFPCSHMSNQKKIHILKQQKTVHHWYTTSITLSYLVLKFFPPRHVRKKWRPHVIPAHLFLVADTRLYTLPCRSVRPSVRPSVGHISEFRAVFAVLLLPNRPRLDCRVSGLVSITSIHFFFSHVILSYLSFCIVDSPLSSIKFSLLFWITLLFSVFISPSSSFYPHFSFFPSFLPPLRTVFSFSFGHFSLPWLSPLIILMSLLFLFIFVMG